MAATSQAPLYRTPPNSDIQLYNAQRMSPMNSASGTPAELSPTSPRDTPGLPYLPFQTRQLHPPKSPLYVPAVLRPTERPTKSSLAPLTPPRSVSSSFDSLNSEESERILSRRSTGDRPKKLGKVVEDERIDEEGFGRVTGLPSRDHWKPDSVASICDSPTCVKTFSLFERRHHCRRCGNVFCNEHTPYSIPLDQLAAFHPGGAQSRACDHCWAEYKKWEIARCRRKNSGSSDGSTLTPGTPNLGIGGAKNRSALTVPPTGQSGQKIGSFAGSVPRDWNWSTF